MKITKDISLPLLGIVIYTLTPFIGSIFGLGDNTRLIFQAPALFMVLVGIRRMPHNHHQMYNHNSFMNLLFAFYVILLVVMFLRGYSLSERLPGSSIWGLLYFYIGDPYYILWIFMPFVVLGMYPNYSFKGLVRIAYWVCILCGVATILTFPQLLNYSMMNAVGLDTDYSHSQFQYARLGLALGPLLLCIKYLSRKQRNIIILSFVINILAVIVMARRGALFMSILLVFFCLWLYYSRGSVSQKIGIVFLTIVLIGSYYAFSSSSIFNYLTARGLEDSRSGVDEALLSQMDNFELWFGKGLNGRYYYSLPGVGGEIYKGYRYSSETGFYNIVLKGGYVMAITYIILLLVPALLGIFKSKNYFCRAGGLYILWSVIYLYPFGVLSFDISFFFIWMWVILCSTPQVRNMSDKQIKLTWF